jgi:hypothetical protein
MINLTRGVPPVEVFPIEDLIRASEKIYEKMSTSFAIPACTRILHYLSNLAKNMIDNDQSYRETVH